MLSPKLWDGFTSAIFQSNLERLHTANTFVTPALMGPTDHLHLGAIVTAKRFTKEDSPALSHTAKDGSEESARGCLAKV